MYFNCLYLNLYLYIYIYIYLYLYLYLSIYLSLSLYIYIYIWKMVTGSIYVIQYRYSRKSSTSGFLSSWVHLRACIQQYLGIPSNALKDYDRCSWLRTQEYSKTLQESLDAFFMGTFFGIACCILINLR